MPDILDSLKEHIHPEFLREAAKKYGESEMGVFKAIHSLGPTILAGLLEKCGDSHAIDPIFESLRSFDPGVLQNLDVLLDDNHSLPGNPIEIGTRLNSTIFGAKTPAITNALAAFSEVKPATVSGLMGLTSCLMMALLSQKINAEALRPTALMRYLLAEKSRIVSLLPAGVGALLGMANQAGAGLPTKGGRARFGWVWVFLVLLVLLLLLVYGLTGR